MAKRKVAKFVKIASATRRHAKENPGGMVAGAVNMVPWMDIGAGVIGYSSTKLVSRVVGAKLTSLQGKLAFLRHVAPFVGVGNFLALLYLTKKWKRARDHQTALLVGAGLAVVQDVVRAWLPQLGWLVGLPAPVVKTRVLPMVAPSPDDDMDIDGTEPYPEAPPTSSKNVGSPESTGDEEEYLNTVLDDEDADLYGGSFARKN